MSNLDVILKWRGKIVEKLSKRQERKKSISKKLSSKSPILAHIIVFSKYYYIWDKKWIFYDQVRALKSAALKRTFEFLLNVTQFAMRKVIWKVDGLHKHSELFCLFSFGNWKFENLPISSPLCIKMFFRPYIFVIQSKKVYRLSRTLIKIAFNSGGNCFFAYFSIFSLVSQGRYLVKSHICGILWRK